MSAAARRVRRVRLSAPRPELVRRGAVLLEDALHTASIPAAEGGRLVLVRRLDVGRIHPRAAPSTLALAIERRLREVELAAVPPDDPAAPRASAVCFRGRVEACAALAVRLAAGGRAEEWFWPSAVPGWRRGMAADDGIRLALRVAAESPQGAAAVAEVLRAADARGVADRVVSAVHPAFAAALLRSLGWTAGDAGGADLEEPVPPAWRPLLARWIGAWGADDARSPWLGAMALLAERPPRAADRTLPARAAALVRAVLTTLTTTPDRRGHAPAEAAAPRGRHPRIESDDADHPNLAAGAVEADAAPPAVPPPDPIPADPIRPGRRQTDSPAADRDHPRPSNGIPATEPGPPPRVREVEREDRHHPPKPRQTPEPRQAVQVVDAPEGPVEAARESSAGADEATEAGGLLFLVAAVQRLGMEETLERHPALVEAELPGRVLLRVAERTRVPPRDPAIARLHAARDAGETARRYPFESPAAWSQVARAEEGRERIEPRRTLSLDASGRLLLALRPGEARDDRHPPNPTDLELVVEAWVTALRRWCRRRARIGLHGLVRRRGRVAFTRTHVDVTLPLREADVRVRAAGLDLDPGWVPWLGRVVAFHYTE